MFFEQEISHEPESNTSASCELVSTSQLNTSVCSSTFLHWSINKSANRTLYKKISASGCGNFEKVEKDLKTLQNLIDTYLPKLSHRLMSLLCNYSFDECTKDFSHDKASNTKAVCAEISKLHLKNILKIAPLLDISCLPIPECTRNESKESNVWSCPKPLIPTRTQFARKFGLYCSPPCKQSTSKTGAMIFKITLYISVLIYWVSIAVIFITWAKAKKLYAETP